MMTVMIVFSSLQNFCWALLELLIQYNATVEKNDNVRQISRRFVESLPWTAERFTTIVEFSVIADSVE